MDSFILRAANSSFRIAIRDSKQTPEGPDQVPRTFVRMAEFVDSTSWIPIRDLRQISKILNKVQNGAEKVRQSRPHAVLSYTPSRIQYRCNPRHGSALDPANYY